jgi:hypothetical protein
MWPVRFSARFLPASYTSQNDFVIFASGEMRRQDGKTRTTFYSRYSRLILFDQGIPSNQ